MRRSVLGAVAASALVATPAAAEPVSWSHGTLDARWTATQPNTASGSSYDATYHAAGDPSSPPPYMRRMIFYNPHGARYDTSVPDRCTASDAELAVRGAEACPPGSRLGGGETTVAFGGRFPATTRLDLVNNTNEQIIVARSPLVATVARGRIRPDGSIEFASPTCWPTVGDAPCPADTVLQVRSSMRVPAYARTIDGVERSYLTTPPKCPGTGYWDGPVWFSWADGSEQTVVSRTACTQAAERAASRRPGIRLRVHPRRVPVGRRVRIRFVVRSGGKPVPRASVRIAGRTARTDLHGRARLAMRFRHARRYAASASRTGYGSDTDHVRAVRRPAFAG